MKLHKLTVLFFIFTCLQVFAIKAEVDFSSIENPLVSIESILSIDTFEELEAQNIIAAANNYQSESTQNQFTGKDLKDLAIGSMYNGDKEKAVGFIEAYIKQEYDPTILYDQTFTSLKDTAAFKKLEETFLFEVNGWILFFFATALIGIFLSVVINLRKKGDSQGNLMMGLFIFFHSCFIIHLCMYISKINFGYPHSLYLSTSFSFLYGPLLYFYYRRVTEKYVMKKTDLLHLVPSLILVIYLFPTYSLPAQEKLHLLFNRNEILYPLMTSIIVIKYMSLGIYAFLVYKLYKKKLEKRRNEMGSQAVKWQRNLMVLNSLYVVFYIVYSFALLNNIMTHILIYPQIFLMSCIILYLGYIAYAQPSVFSKKLLFGKLTLEKYQKSGLTDSFSLELKDQLLLLFVEEKIYKQSNISLGVLAQRLGTTRHNVSQVINEHFDLNFFHLVNKYRIEEAKEILKNDQNKNMNIIDVAYDVGFNNKVTFNKAFKAQTNMTPSLYLRSIA
jgi:AraC-like DNA-binding protein